MSRKSFASPAQYTAALREVIREGVTKNQLELLRIHALAPRRTKSAQSLAKELGYRNYGAVNMQYGALAHRVAEKLGIHQVPSEGFWLYVLVDWANTSAPSKETMFVLRREVFDAIKEIGIIAPLPQNLTGAPRILS